MPGRPGGVPAVGGPTIVRNFGPPSFRSYGTVWSQSFSATLSFAASVFGNVISYWKLDEASGTRLDSVTATGNDLTDNNAVGNAAGVINNAALFVAASSQYLSHASNASLQMAGNTNWTISAWIKLTSLPANLAEYSLVTKDSDAANSRDFTLDYQRNDGAPSTAGFRLYIQGGATYIAVVGAAATTGIFYHLVAWYDSSNGQLHLRINDTTTYDSITGATGTDVSSAEFRIGARQYAGFNDFADAAIDEVGIWKRLLTPAEITALYNSGAGLAYSAGGSGPTLTRKTLKALTATGSFAGALTKSIGHLLSATFSPTGSIVKFLSFSVTKMKGSVNFSGALARQTNKVLFISQLNWTSLFTKRISKGLGANLSFTGALKRQTNKVFGAALSFIGTLATQLFHAGGTLFFKSFTATLSFSGSLSQQFTKFVNHFCNAFTSGVRAVTAALHAVVSKPSRSVAPTTRTTVQPDPNAANPPDCR